jgi:putative NADH-flavin reductase
VAHVLIIGASGGIGLAATRQALDQGHAVRAFARSARQISLDHPLLEKFSGDALNRSAVTAAVQDVDAVISALGISPGLAMIFGPVELFSASTRLLISSTGKARAKRLICVTGFGAGESRKAVSRSQRIPFELALGRAYADKDRQERVVRRSDLDWTIVRPVILTGGPKTGRYEVLCDPAEWRNGTVSRADVADFLVSQIGDDRYLGKAPVIRST